MMTRLEAAERATKIWPEWSTITRIEYNNLWWVAVGTVVHTLDGNGHTICHPECARIEENL